MSAAPAPKPPDDDVLVILRRLEPMLAENRAGQAAILARLDRLDERQRKQGEDLAELKGRVTVLPTLWQIVSPLLGIFAALVAIAGATVALIRWASGS